MNALKTPENVVRSLLPESNRLLSRLARLTVPPANAPASAPQRGAARVVCLRGPFGICIIECGRFVPSERRLNGNSVGDMEARLIHVTG